MVKMSDEQIKHAIEGFTTLMRGMWNNQDFYIPDEIADKYNISEEFRKKEKENKSKSHKAQT